MTKIAASILSADFANLKHDCTRRGCDTLIEVDGGINTETGPLCIAAGADWLVAGSALFHAMDPAAVVNVLHSK